MIIDPQLDARIQKIVKFWSSRLIYDHDYNGMCLIEDLQNTSLGKAYAPKTVAKLELIWKSEGDRGGLIGLSKYLSRLVTNCFNDYLRKEIPRAYRTVEGDAPTEKDAESGEMVGGSLWEIYDPEESGQFQPFLLHELREELAPNEYQLIVDYVLQDATIDNLAEESKDSWSTKQREVAKVKEKTKKVLTKLLAREKKCNVPVWRMTSLTADRIPPVVRDSFLYGKVALYTVCPHLLAASTVEVHGKQAYLNHRNNVVAPESKGWQVQDFSIGGVGIVGRWALCAPCWQHYWAELDRRLVLRRLFERDYDKYVLELATEGLANPKI